MNIEEGWKTYSKRQSQFKTFDLLFKKEKRTKRLQKNREQAKRLGEIAEEVNLLIEQKMSLELTDAKRLELE